MSRISPPLYVAGSFSEPYSQYHYILPDARFLVETAMDEGLESNMSDEEKIDVQNSSQPSDCLHPSHMEGVKEEASDNLALDKSDFNFDTQNFSQFANCPQSSQIEDIKEDSSDSLLFDENFDLQSYVLTTPPPFQPTPHDNSPALAEGGVQGSTSNHLPLSLSNPKNGDMASSNPSEPSALNPSNLIDPEIQENSFQIIGNNSILVCEANNVVQDSENTTIIANGKIKGIDIALSFQGLNPEEIRRSKSEGLMLKFAVAREMNNGEIIPAQRICNLHSRDLGDQSILRAKNGDRNVFYESAGCLLPGILFSIKEEDIDEDGGICIKSIGLLINCFNTCQTSEQLMPKVNAVKMTKRLHLVATLETLRNRQTMRRTLMPMMCKARLSKKDRSGLPPVAHDKLQRMKGNTCRYLAATLLKQCLKLEIDLVQVYREAQKMQLNQDRTPLK